MATQADIKSILLNLPQEDYESAKKEADKLGISMTAFIRLLLKQWTDGITFEKKNKGNNGSNE